MTNENNQSYVLVNWLLCGYNELSFLEWAFRECHRLIQEKGVSYVLSNKKAIGANLCDKYGGKYLDCIKSEIVFVLRQSTNLYIKSK